MYVQKISRPMEQFPTQLVLPKGLWNKLQNMRKLEMLATLHLAPFNN